MRSLLAPIRRHSYATLAMIKAATPCSSVLADIFKVTPDLAENAILTIAATFPPDIVFPYSLRVCVLVERTTSVPSSACKERALANCSVASDQISNKDNKVKSAPL